MPIAAVRDAGPAALLLVRDLSRRSYVPHGYAAVGAEPVLASLLVRYPATPLSL